jgi:hypothetical protein
MGDGIDTTQIPLGNRKILRIAHAPVKALRIGGMDPSRAAFPAALAKWHLFGIIEL